jgi:hypothetical protein
MTAVIPSIVSDVSAMLVANITLRRSLRSNTLSCSSFGRLP